MKVLFSVKLLFLSLCLPFGILTLARLTVLNKIKYVLTNVVEQEVFLLDPGPRLSNP